MVAVAVVSRGRNSSAGWQHRRDEVNLPWSQGTPKHSAALATYAGLVSASRSTYD